jgi:hypothetical protein
MAPPLFSHPEGPDQVAHEGVYFSYGVFLSLISIFSIFIPHNSLLEGKEKRRPGRGFSGVGFGNLGTGFSLSRTGILASKMGYDIISLKNDSPRLGKWPRGEIFWRFI